MALACVFTTVNTTPHSLRNLITSFLLIKKKVPIFKNYMLHSFVIRTASPSLRSVCLSKVNKRLDHHQYLDCI